MSPVEHAARNRSASSRLALLIGIEAVASLADTMPGPADQLPAGRLLAVEHRRDLAVAVVEDVVQQERSPLDRGELFEHDQERHATASRRARRGIRAASSSARRSTGSGSQGPT